MSKWKKVILNFHNDKIFKDRTAYLIELFFDLTIVALAGIMIDNLIEIFEKTTIDWVFAMFSFVIILLALGIWWAISMFLAEVDSAKVNIHRILIFLMIPLLVIAGTGYIAKFSNQAFSPIIWIIYLIVAFAILYLLVARLFLMIALAYQKQKSIWLHNWNKVVTYFSLVLILIVDFVISLLYQTNSAFLMIYNLVTFATCLVILVIQAAAASFLARQKIIINTPKLLKERMALLYIIFLGEMLVEITSSFGHNIVNSYQQTTNFEHTLITICLLLIDVFIIFYWFLNFQTNNKKLVRYTTFTFVMHSLLVILSLIGIIWTTIGLAMLTLDNQHLLRAEVFIVVGSFFYAFPWLFINIIAQKMFSRKILYWFALRTVVLAIYIGGVFTSIGLHSVFPIPLVLLGGSFVTSYIEKWLSRRQLRQQI